MLGDWPCRCLPRAPPGCRRLLHTHSRSWAPTFPTPCLQTALQRGGKVQRTAAMCLPRARRSCLEHAWRHPAATVSSLAPGPFGLVATGTQPRSCRRAAAEELPCLCERSCVCTSPSAAPARPQTPIVRLGAGAKPPHCRPLVVPRHVCWSWAPVPRAVLLQCSLEMQSCGFAIISACGVIPGVVIK